MRDLLNLIRWMLVGLFRSRASLRTENLALRHQLNVLRRHRSGFRLFWRWKSRVRSGRPQVPLEVRRLIREMSLANPFWGAPRIHGQLLKLGIDVGQTSVAKYMARHRRPPSQGWRTFLLSHAEQHLRRVLRSYQQYYNGARTH